MESFITLSIQLHLFFIGILVVLMGVNLYWLKSGKVFVKLSKKLELVAPQYYIVLCAIFFTGIIVMAVKQFDFTLSVGVMLGVWFLILVWDIKKSKVYRKMDKMNFAEQTNYKHIAVKKYAIDLALVVGTIIFTYMVH